MNRRAVSERGRPARFARAKWKPASNLRRARRTADGQPKRPGWPRAGSRAQYGPVLASRLPMNRVEGIASSMPTLDQSGQRQSAALQKRGSWSQYLRRNERRSSMTPTQARACRGALIAPSIVSTTRTVRSRGRNQSRRPTQSARRTSRFSAAQPEVPLLRSRRQGHLD